MTIMTRWGPARERSTLQDRMNRLLRESYRPRNISQELAA
jgi:hypothetical protein